MKKYKINFTGNFWEYLGLTIGLLLLTIVTFGIALPYFIYWNSKYFFSHLELEFKE